jgi:hypothetical protein
MGGFNTVFDLMNGAAGGKVFREKRVSDSALDEQDHFDGELAEFQMMSLVERNILGGTSMPDNFTIDKGSREIKIGITAVAKARNSGGGVTDLVNTKEVLLKPFENVEDWKLEPESGMVYYSDHMGKKGDRDSVLIGEVRAQCTNMSESEASGIPMTMLTEALSRKTNMVHMFMKAYLLLMDLNLSVLVRNDVRRVRRLNQHYHDGVDNNRKMGLMISRNIVIDAEGFSGDELYTLSLMAQSYPPIKFCDDNVYNTCNMDSDSLAIVSSFQIDREEKQIPTPGEMYRNIVSLACKLNCTDDMMEAFEMMRGRMSHIRDANNITLDRTYSSGVFKSVNYYRALGGSTRHAIVCSSFPAYLSTSVGLVADLLLGSTYEVAASLLIEELGGLGKLTCPDPPRSDEMYNGILRDYGLSSKDGQLNELTVAWQGIGKGTYNWHPRETWKPYLVSLTEQLRNGQEVAIPQLCYEIAHMTTLENVWGALRGYQGINGSGLASMADIGEGAPRRKDDRLRLAAAFTWAMGVRHSRPKMFNNAWSSKEVALSTKERQFLAASMGGYTLSFVSYTLSEEVLGREEWTEMAATSIIRSAINGTKCSMIVSTAGIWHVKEYASEQEAVEGITDSIHTKALDGKSNKYDEEIMKMATQAGGSLDREEKTSDVMDRLKGVLVYDKVSVSGEPLLGKEDITAIRKIEVPGDGKCGIHAVVASMKEKGMLRLGEEKLAFDNFDGKLKEETFHDAAQIAAALLDFGVGLRVYEHQDSNKYRVIDFGDTASSAIAIERRGAHFSGVVEGAGEPVIMTHYEGGILNNSEQAEAIKEMRKFFR